MSFHSSLKCLRKLILHVSSFLVEAFFRKSKLADSWKWADIDTFAENYLLSIHTLKAVEKGFWELLEFRTPTLKLELLRNFIEAVSAHICGGLGTGLWKRQSEGSKTPKFNVVEGILRRCLFYLNEPRTTVSIRQAMHLLQLFEVH